MDFAWWPTWRGNAIWAYAAIPLWLMAAGAAVPPVVLWRLDNLARRRARLNHCPACNYDRHGLSAASPCPECGGAPALSARACT